MTVRRGHACRCVCEQIELHKIYARACLACAYTIWHMTCIQFVCLHAVAFNCIQFDFQLYGDTSRSETANIACLQYQCERPLYLPQSMRHIPVPSRIRYTIFCYCSTWRGLLVSASLCGVFLSGAIPSVSSSDV